MTVIFSKKCEVGLQAVLFLSAQPAGRLFTSQEISKEIKQPKEFVSKMLQVLTPSGIVASKKGKNGGFYLGRDPKFVRLIDIVAAIDGLEIFYNCVLGFPGCSHSAPCPVHDKWGKLRDDAYKMLSDETLDNLKEITRHKIMTLRT